MNKLLILTCAAAIGIAASASAAVVDLSTITADRTLNDGDLATGKLGSDVKISIADKATVLLFGVTIKGENATGTGAGITCAGDATLIIEGENTVKALRNGYPGIYVPENKTLTIKGDGSLTVSANGTGNGGAGIGGGISTNNGGPGNCGNIVIEGGTIFATGGAGAAGIGSGYVTDCGDITIEGGTITATGGYGAAGIGGGNRSACGNITITKDVTSVTATKGGIAPNSIGAGADNVSCGTVTTSVAVR